MRDHTMPGMDDLVQRFIDRELTGDERIDLLVRLGRDAALRERVLDLERLTLEAGRLPRPMVPDRFVSAVLARIEPPASLWQRATAALWAPRNLHWNLAGALGACTVVVLAVTLAVSQIPGRSTPIAPGPSIAAGTASASTKVLVRLVVLQPGAGAVAVAGDFNQWDAGRTPLEPTGGGAWAVTLPLDPGRYEYMFVVDGERWVADPFAVELNDDGFGGRNAVLDVRPPAEAAL